MRVVTLAVTACPPAVTDGTAVQKKETRDTHNAPYRPQGRRLAMLPSYRGSLWNVPSSSSLLVCQWCCWLKYPKR